MTVRLMEANLTIVFNQWPVDCLITSIHFWPWPCIWFCWAISGLVLTTVMFVSRWESNFVKYCSRTCMLLTDSSRACRFSSSSFCLLILSFSALASAMAVRKESMIPKKSSGLFCEGSSPKNSHTESNFWRIKEEQRF